MFRLSGTNVQDRDRQHLPLEAPPVSARFLTHKKGRPPMWTAGPQAADLDTCRMAQAGKTSGLLEAGIHRNLNFLRVDIIVRGVHPENVCSCTVRIYVCERIFRREHDGDEFSLSRLPLV